KRNAEIAGMESSLLADKNSLESLSRTVGEKLKIYGIEIDAIQSVSDAKKALDDAYQKIDTTSGSEMEQIARQNDFGQVARQTVEIAKARESLNALQQASKQGFNFANTLNTPKDKKSNSAPTIPTAEDVSLQKESLQLAKSAYEITKQNNDLLETKAKNAEKEKDYQKAIELTTELLKGQNQAIQDLETAK